VSISTVGSTPPVILAGTERAEGPGPDHDGDSDDAGAAAPIQAQPAPGTGQIIDKTA